MIMKHLKRTKVSSAKIAGAHPSGPRFAITDGVLTVLLEEKPDGIPEADHSDIFYQYASEFLGRGNTHIVYQPPTVEDCKRVIDDWNKIPASSFERKPAFPQIMVSTVDERGSSLISYFNAKLYREALEVAGTFHSVYLGRCDKFRMSLPCLFVFQNSKNGKTNWIEPVFLLPCRPTN